MKNKFLFVIILLVFLLLGCSDDLLHNGEPNEDSNLPGVEAYLSLSINDIVIASSDCRVDEQKVEISDIENRIENTINDIWIFQYDNSGSRIIGPQYITINDQSELAHLKAELAQGESRICVVANTGDEQWGNRTNFETYEGLKSSALPLSEPIMISESDPKSIPMEGTINATVAGGTIISVPVYRMYAKLRISFGHLVDKGMKPKSIEINNIPTYCRVHTLSDGLPEGSKAEYDENTEWITRSFNATEISEDGVEPEDRDYIIYIPENLQGETTANFKGEEPQEGSSIAVPANALVVKYSLNYTYWEPVPDQAYDISLQEDRKYTVYPGGNTTNNFNIKRNHEYRIRINVYKSEQYTPSSNCFVVIPGNAIAFEPYYRTEKGGNYRFKDYLDPAVADKKISTVRIIWQTKEVIGDNSAGDKVWFVENKDNPEHSKIIVRTDKEEGITPKEGNALIGAYNSAGEIIWSWHVWVTANDPGNVGNAIVYDTYSWNHNNGINTNQKDRVPGYAVMPCNLGALALGPEEPVNDNTPEDSWYCENFRTYGTLYQWGRKDPFPPMKLENKRYMFYNYDQNSGEDGANIEVYDNSHVRITMTTNGAIDSSELFSTVKSNTLSNTKAGINYSINHPTVHIAGAIEFIDNDAISTPSNYFNRGDWLPGGDEKLWGGIPKTSGLEHYVITEDVSSIWRNYGPDKTIFDPCPQGWRVPPGDLWLGFTIDGRNQNGLSINASNETLWDICNISREYGKSFYNQYNGFWICLNGWHSDDKSNYSFFPTQGSRIASGQPLHGGCCGNYHNATCDSPWNNKLDNNGNRIDRVNILHLHCVDDQFSVYTFEPGLGYSNKSVAGPVRCVRDTK